MQISKCNVYHKPTTVKIKSTELVTNYAQTACNHLVGWSVESLQEIPQMVTNIITPCALFFATFLLKLTQPGIASSDPPIPKTQP